MRTFLWKQFYWKPEDLTGTAEASSLGILPGEKPLARLSPDSWDVGFQVEMVTGEIAHYYLHTTNEAHGDLQSWELQATPETVRKIPVTKGTKIIIFND